MTPDLGIQPRPHWWEVSALTTVPSLHPPLRRPCTPLPSAKQGPLPKILLIQLIGSTHFIQGRINLSNNLSQQSQEQKKNDHQVQLPFSKNIQTRKTFLTRVLKLFPKSHKYHKIVHKNFFLSSYSCMDNMKTNNNRQRKNSKF